MRNSKKQKPKNMKTHQFLYQIDPPKKLSMKENFLVFNTEKPGETVGRAERRGIDHGPEVRKLKNTDEVIGVVTPFEIKIEGTIFQKPENRSAFFDSEFAKNIGEKIAPDNAESQAFIGIEIAKNFADNTLQEVYSGMNEGKITSLRFETVEKEGQAFLKYTAIDKDGKEGKSHEFKIAPSILEKYEVKKEEVKEAATTERTKEGEKPAVELKEKSFSEMLQEAGIEIKDERYTFTVDGVERSFFVNEEFNEQLKQLKSPNQIKLNVYAKLLEIIKNDKSYYKEINGKKNRFYNRHKIADNEKFEASNKGLETQIAKLESEIKAIPGGPQDAPENKPPQVAPGAEAKPEAKPDAKEAETKLFANPNFPHITKLPEDGKWYPAKDVTDGSEDPLQSLSLKGLETALMAKDGELHAKIDYDYIFNIFKGKSEDEMKYDREELKENYYEIYTQKVLKSFKEDKAENLKDFIEKQLKNYEAAEDHHTWAGDLNTILEAKKITKETFVTDLQAKLEKPAGPPQTEVPPGGKPSTDVKPEKGAKPEIKPTPKPLADLPKALESFKSANIEIKKPEKLESLTQEQLETILKTKEEITKALKEKSNAYAVAEALKELGTNLDQVSPAGTEYEINFTLDKTNFPFTWNSNEDANGGFGPTKKPNSTGESQGLIDKILRTKAYMDGAKSKEYEKFFEDTVSAKDEVETAEREAKSASQYIEKYKELSSESYETDPRIDNLWESEIEKKWNEFDGYASVDAILKEYPFGIWEKDFAKIGAKILSEGDNKEIKLEDIFDVMKTLGGFPDVVAKKVIPAELLRDYDDFTEKFEELTSKGNLTPKEDALMAAMYTDVLVPCFRLMEKMRDLRYPEEEAKEMSEDDILHAGLAENQKDNLESLKKLFFYTDQPAGAWDKFINFVSGGGRTVTMSRVDGSTYVLDEGVFRRHFTPSAAILGFLNKADPSKLYKLDASGKKVLDEAKVVKEINEILKRGVLQLQLEYQIKHNKDPEGEKYDPAKYQISSIKDINKLTDEQLLVFQLGFINERVNAFEQSVKTVDEILKDAPAGLKAILKELKDKVPARQLDKIKSAMLGVGYVHFHKKGDGNYEASGAGIGVPIDLGDGHSLMIMGGANWSGQGSPVFAGVGLNFQVYKGDVLTTSIPVGISVMGVGAGVAAKADVGGGVELSADFGVGISWAAPLQAGLTAGVGVSWEGAIINGRLEAKNEEAKESSGLKEIWENWETLPESKKWEAIQKLQAFKKIEETMRKNPEIMTKEAVINMVDLYYEQVKDKDVYDQMSAMPFVPTGIKFNAAVITTAFSTFGLGLLGGLTFQIGSVTVFIPHPREELRILNEISNANMESKIKAALLAKTKEEFEKMRQGKSEIVFKENSPNIYYRPGKTPGIRTEKQEINFKGLQEKVESSKVESSLDVYNEALSPAEIRLAAHGKSTELIIDNDDDKDVELHIDPKLHELAVVKDNGRLFLAGNINDLIITRERFEFNNPLADGKTSIRDVITIRQAKSFKGDKKRDRLWIEKYEENYFEKIMGQNNYAIKKGQNYHGLRQGNVVDAPGFAEGKVEGGIKSRIDYHEKFRETAEAQKTTKGLTEKRVDQLDAEANEMQKALGARLEEDYQNEQLREGFYETLNALYKNPKIKAEIEKIENIENPENMVAIIEREGQIKLTDKEANVAISHLLNLHYTTLDSQSRTKILERLKRVKKYTESKYLQEFTSLGYENAQEMVARFTGDIYTELVNKLSDKNFSFTKDLQVGNKLESGDIFVSGTRGTVNGGYKRALGRTINFEKTPQTQLHPFGFFEAEGMKIGEKYNLQSKDPVEKNLARALLEIASPMPKDNLEVLKSPLAVKLLGMKVYRLIVEEENGGGAEQYNQMMEIVKDPSKAANYPDVLSKFRAFVERVRAAQISENPTLEIKTSDGLVIKLDLSETKIVSGSYTKCGNASHAANEKIKVEIARIPEETVEKPQVVGAMITTNTISNAKLSKKFVSFGLFVGFTSEEAEEKRGKHSTDTQVAEEPVSDKAAGAGAAEAPDGSTFAPDPEGKDSI